MSVYASAKVQCFYSDMDHLSGICTGRRGYVDGDDAAGFGLYCGGYASGAGCTRDHGTHVQEHFQHGLHGRHADAVIICLAGNQLLLPVACGDRGEPVETFQKIKS